jgi:hypothetical protein
MRPLPSIRKLAALDIVFLGFKVVFAEYLCGVLLYIVLGVFVLLRTNSVYQIVLGAYLIFLGINYIPMFLYALSIANREKARAEIADELTNRREAMSRYRRVSLLLLVPLLVPIVALAQGRRFARAHP